MKINDENFLLFAAHYYDNPHCFDTNEFYDDLKRFKYIKRLFIKYRDQNILRERLILNHIIILYNVFGSGCTDMMFLKLSEFKKEMKPFLLLLNRMPENIEINGTVIHNTDIPIDKVIVERLRGI